MTPWNEGARIVASPARAPAPTLTRKVRLFIYLLPYDILAFITWLVNAVLPKIKQELYKNSRFPLYNLIMLSPNDARIVRRLKRSIQAIASVVATSQAITDSALAANPILKAIRAEGIAV